MDFGKPARPTSINKATVEDFNRISRRMSIAESEYLEMVQSEEFD